MATDSGRRWHVGRGQPTNTLVATQAQLLAWFTGRSDGSDISRESDHPLPVLRMWAIYALRGRQQPGPGCAYQPLHRCAGLEKRQKVRLSVRRGAGRAVGGILMAAPGIYAERQTHGTSEAHGDCTSDNGGTRPARFFLASAGSRDAFRG